MKYDVDYFLNKFDAIPARKWTTGKFSSEKGRYCALGHCGVMNGKAFTTLGEEAAALNQLFHDTLKVNIIRINDKWNYIDTHADGQGYTVGFDIIHLGRTPKERVMNALILIKAGVTY